MMEMEPRRSARCRTRRENAGQYGCWLLIIPGVKQYQNQLAKAVIKQNN